MISENISNGSTINAVKPEPLIKSSKAPRKIPSLRISGDGAPAKLAWIPASGLRRSGVFFTRCGVFDEDQIEVAEIDDQTQALPENKDGIHFVDRIGEEDDPAAERKIPKHNRYDTAACPFARPPLHHAA